MFPNIFPSMIMLTIQVISILQLMKPIFLLFNGFHRTGIYQFAFSLIQDGSMEGMRKGSQVVSWNTFSFNPFLTQLKIFRFIPITSLKLLNLNQDHPSKKSIFLVKSVWIWSYKNFSHKNAKLTKIWSCEHIYYIIWAAW